MSAADCVILTDKGASWCWLWGINAMLKWSSWCWRSQNQLWRFSASNQIHLVVKKNPMSLLINSRLLFSVLVLQTNDIAETDPFCREKKSDKNLLWKFLVARYATLHPVMSVRRSVPFLLFWCFWAFWEYGSCPDALVTFSSTAPAHPHATRVAVYPALFENAPLPNKTFPNNALYYVCRTVLSLQVATCITSKFASVQKLSLIGMT